MQQPCDNRVISQTSGDSRKCVKRNGPDSINVSRFCTVRNSIFGSISKNV